MKVLTRKYHIFFFNIDVPHYKIFLRMASRASLCSYHMPNVSSP